MSYADSRVVRAAWNKVRTETEAHWWVLARFRLASGSALTSELAEAAGIKPGVEYGRFMVLLNRHRKSGLIRIAGQRRGAHHMNNVWELIK